MTKIQYVLKEIDCLDLHDLGITLEVIYKKISKEKKVQSILNECKGIGAGIWKVDVRSTRTRSSMNKL